VRSRAGSCRVFAAQEAIDDSIGERNQAPGPLVVFRKEAGDTHEWQRALALPGIQVAIAARHSASDESRGLGGSVGKDPIPQANFLREFGIVQRFVE
jgi:hypothetical protein